MSADGAGTLRPMVAVRSAARRIPGAQALYDLLRRAVGQEGRCRVGSPRPVVYLPTWVRWDVMAQRPQFLLEAFAAAGHPVFFVDPEETAIRRVKGVTIVPSLEQVPHEEVILYLHFAPLQHLFPEFSHFAVVYDILDDLSIYDPDEVGMPEERRVRRHHPQVMDRADVVMVSNPVLARIHRHEREDLLLVSNGVDTKRFGRPAAPPPDLIPDGRPVVGYHGMISYWFDFDLLEAVARSRPGYRFVLVGPHDTEVGEQVEQLRALPNVEVLGERPSPAMPSYVQSFAVGTVWFRLGEMTAGVTPLKMYEYLAAGVPCVATPLPACVEEEAVVTAGDPAGFAAALDAAIADPDPGRWRAAAAAHDWNTLIRPVLARLATLGLDRVSRPPR